MEAIHKIILPLNSKLLIHNMFQPQGWTGSDDLPWKHTVLSYQIESDLTKNLFVYGRNQWYGSPNHVPAWLYNMQHIPGHLVFQLFGVRWSCSIWLSENGGLLFVV